MKRFVKHSRAGFFVVVVAALALGSVRRDARACGGELTGVVYTNVKNPELPIERWVNGSLGVIAEGSWRRPWMVLAFRALRGVDATEAQTHELGRYVSRVFHEVDPRVFDRALPQRADVATELSAGVLDGERWRAARAEVVGDRGPEINNGWESDFALTPNCLGDAFAVAAAALRARAGAYGSSSRVVNEWVHAQDQVFGNCGAQPGSVPEALSQGAPQEQRRDREYQRAAAHFYAGSYEAAEQEFRAIANDRGSPWSVISRYLVVRTIARAAQRARPTPDQATLDRAAHEAEVILADPSASTLHAALRSYVSWLDGMRNPAGRAHALGSALADGTTTGPFDTALGDYDHLLDAHSTAVFSTPPTELDALTMWLWVVERGHSAAPNGGANAGLTLALSRYAQTRAREWLVAVLIAPGAERDPRVETVLAEAERLPVTDVAYATVQYHRLRLLAARGRGVFTDAERALAVLAAHGDATQNTRNLFRELMVGSSRSIEELMTVGYGLAVGRDDATGVITPIEGNAVEGLSPRAQSTLSRGVPLGVLLRGARARGLPVWLIDQVLTVALSRAALLGDTNGFLAAVALAGSASPEARARLSGLLSSSPEGRTLALLRALQSGAAAMNFTTPMLDGGDTTGDLWQGRCDRSPTVVHPAGFLTARERDAWRRERALWASLGDGPTFMAREAARLARAHRRDEGMAAVLASAVHATRNNGCARGASVHTASRAAFRALHEIFPRSPEARRTRYWY